MVNAQGASERTEHSTKSDVKSQIRNWYDPENLKAIVYKNIDDNGNNIFPDEIYNGRSLSFK